MNKIIESLLKRIPKPDGWSLSFPPALNFSFRKKEAVKSVANNLDHFEHLLLNRADWTKEFIDHKEVWVCKADNVFQIEIAHASDDFQEPWSAVYPDPNAHKTAVYLKINGVSIKQLTFIACDGGRIFVPIPDREFVDEKVAYKWRRSSLGYKVCRIIGEYYIYNNIEGVAERSKVEIVA